MQRLAERQFFIVRAIIAVGVAAPALMLPSVSIALEYSVLADYQAEYTNNARRSGGDETSDVIHRPGLSASASHTGPATELSLDYRIQRRIYQDDTFDDDILAQGSARATWHERPDRLSLFVSNDRRESRIRTEGESVPDNLQVSSRTTAGATARADLLSNHYGTLTYTFTDIAAEETRTESSRHSVQVAYGIPLTPRDTLQLVGSGTDVDFDDPLAPDYQSVTVSLDYDRNGPRTSLGFSAGYTSIDRELSRTTADGFVGSAYVTREIGGSSTLSLSYSQSLQDNSLDAWRSEPQFGDEIVVGDTDLNEVFEQKTVSLTYTTQLGVNQVALSATGTREDYEDDFVGRDRERGGLNLRLTRPIRQNLRANAAIEYIRYEFTADERQEDSYGGSLGLGWDPTPRFQVSASVSYYERERATQSLGDTNDWRASLSLSYRLFGSGHR